MNSSETDSRIASLESHIAELEKQVVILLERDKSAREAELALADGGAI